MSKNNIVTSKGAESVKVSYDVSSKERKTNFNVLSLVLGLLLVISLFKMLSGGNPVTFGSLLSAIADAPEISMSMTWFDTLEIVSDWGAFNFFRDFINMITGFYSVIEFCARGLLQVIVYVIWIARFIFF